jgi:hypothetical protein
LEKNSSEVENVPVMIGKTKIKEEDESTVCDSDSSGSSLLIDTGSEYGMSPRKTSRTAREKIGGQRKRNLINDTDSSETSLSSTQNKKSKFGENFVKGPHKINKSKPADLLNVLLQDQEKLMLSQRKQPAENIASSNSTFPKENPPRIY